MIFTHFKDNIFKQAWAQIFFTLKWFPLFLSNMNNSIYY